MSFKRLDPEDISISAESIVTPLWSTNSKTLTTFFTSSGLATSHPSGMIYNVGSSFTRLATAVSATSEVLSTRATFAPFLARILQKSIPKIPAPPVTIATEVI